MTTPPRRLPEAGAVDEWEGRPEFSGDDFDIPDLERPPDLALRIGQARFTAFASLLLAIVAGIYTWAGRLPSLWWAVVAVGVLEAARRFRRARSLASTWPPR